MAEIVLSAVLPIISKKLSYEAMKRINRANGIHSELRKWERSLTHIHTLLTDAFQKEITDQNVKKWLNGLRHLAYDIDDMLDGLATEDAIESESGSGSTSSRVRHLLPTCCTNFSLSSRKKSKLNDIANKLKDLEDEKNTLGLRVIDNVRKNMNRKYETSLPDDESCIVGREDDKQAFINKLLGDEGCKENYSIVPIVGLGGVGKTTLARLLYNDPQVKDHFEVMGWVCVSDEFDVFNVSQDIFQSVTGESKDSKKNLNELQVALQAKLKEKRFLLVLDDVWTENHDDWEKLVPPFRAGARGSKIIVTTRKENLLRQLGCKDLDRVKSLSRRDAVRLFALNAFGVDNFESDRTKFKTIGEGIVEKCDGLPLALKALGRLLREKPYVEDWEDLLNSEIWTLEDANGIIPSIRLSYRDLTADLKQMFAYCSLFPKDYLFDKHELVLLWMAEGFLHPSTSNKLTERFGYECFDKLLSRSFFQHAPNDKSLFVMHDLMSDLATSVAEDFMIRLDIKMNDDSWKEALEQCRHMSFVCEKYIASKKFNGLKRAKSVRTFLALSFESSDSWNRFYVSNKIMSDLLCELPLLRVLSLSHLEISEVPESIGNMKHLRYLNLSQTWIKHLPENVCNLYNLQTLIVCGCHELAELPKSFLKLKNLRHFDIRDTPGLNKMCSRIGELKSLQTLSKIIIGGDNRFEITELRDLTNLHGIISIQGLDNVQNAMHAEDAHLSEKRLTELELQWNDAFDDSRNETLEKEVLKALKPRIDNLLKLRIVSYGGTEFPTWVGDSSFDKLTHVSLRGCQKCTSLPPLGKLPSLKELFIEGMNGVKNVGLELHGTTGQAFRSLEILEFQNMCGWNVWSSKSGISDTVVFPCLRKLSIKHCPNLNEISLDALPTLRVLRIERCDHSVLGSFVSIASSVITLSIRSISGLNDEVWGSVIKYLTAVEKVKIRDCDGIRYLWESEAKASKVLVKLRKLDVGCCSNLVRFGEKEEDNCGSNLTSLTTLYVDSCNRMERCSCPNNIEDLHISYCESITRVSFPTGGGQKLKSLKIWGCENLLEEELGGGEKTTSLINNMTSSMLQSVSIIGWKNLKSITGLSNFIHLSSLTIYNCPNMEAFPDHELLNLTSLKTLFISSCPTTDVSFPRGFWPPKLSALYLGKLKKPISEWGPQNFPTSLVHLTLTGEDVRDFSQLSHLLPSSLTSLWIEDFETLESLSMGLQQLTSLQHLEISSCPMMKELPEMLFPSLLRLWIAGCPAGLKERISRRGSYWPLISHIPCILIDYVSQH